MDVLCICFAYFSKIVMFYVTEKRCSCIQTSPSINVGQMCCGCPSNRTQASFQNVDSHPKWTILYLYIQAFRL